MRYGMNPHQAARIVSTDRPLTIRNGEPSMINYLDALNAWQLVREARKAVHVPVAASSTTLSECRQDRAAVPEKPARMTRPRCYLPSNP